MRTYEAKDGSFLSSCLCAGFMRTAAADLKFTARPFAFSRSHRRIDWRVLHGVDVDRIVRTTDVTALQSVLDLVAFGDIEAEDPLYLSETNFVRIFR